MSLQSTIFKTSWAHNLKIGFCAQSSVLAQKLTIVSALSLSLLFIMALLSPLHAHAQITTVGAATLSFTPAYPAPGGQVEARVEAYAYDISHARIRWSIDGVPQSVTDGAQSITLEAPALGSTRVVSATITESGGAVHTVRESLTTSAIDFIIEGETRVPLFYQGQTLPSSGSAVRLIAIPSLFTAQGARINQSQLVYTWRANKKVVQSGRGADVLDTTMPQVGSLLVEVTIESLDGSARYSALERIEPTEPVMLFYEDNPLYGLSRRALPANFTLLADEISVRAEPYYVSRDIFTNAKHEWKIDNSIVPNPNTDPQTLTLRKTGGVGTAEVSFSIRNLVALAQTTASAFVVYFK